MARGGVVEVDEKLGKVVRVWEGVECTFMATATGGRVRLVSKTYLYKDRLYPDREVSIPKEFFLKFCRQAGAIFASRREKRLKRLSQTLKEAQAGMRNKEQREEQLVLF